MSDTAKTIFRVLLLVNVFIAAFQALAGQYDRATFAMTTAVFMAVVLDL